MNQRGAQRLGYSPVSTIGSNGLGDRAPASWGAGQRHRAGAALAALVRAWLAGALLVGVAAFAQPQPAPGPDIIVVQPGESFSTIAARYTGALWRWRRLYDPRLSGLSDPSLLTAGMQLELVTEASGRRYLRVVGTPTAAAADAPAPAAPPAPAAASAPAQVKSVAAAAPAAAAAAAAPAAAAAAAAPPPARAASAAAAAAQAADDVLVIGVLPNAGGTVLRAQYENLRSWFERHTPQKVRLVVPANVRVFYDSLLRGDYDLAVAAAHFARLAQTEGSMVPLVMYEPRIAALLVSGLDAPVRAALDIRGHSLGLANPGSLVALSGLQWLQRQGLEAGKDFELRPARTDLGAARMLLTGEVAAVMMSHGEFRALPQDEAMRMKVVESFARLPNAIVLAHARLGAARIALLKSQFGAFVADRDEGAAFLLATGVSGMSEVDDAVLQEIDPYAQSARRAMAGSR